MYEEVKSRIKNVSEGIREYVSALGWGWVGD